MTIKKLTVVAVLDLRQLRFIQTQQQPKAHQTRSMVQEKSGENSRKTQKCMQVCTVTVYLQV